MKMSVRTVGEVAENYFNTLNPIAERVSSDIDAIKDAYEDLWQSLSNREKDQIINETVIHPEAILKYALTSNGCESPTLTKRQVTGTKYIVDETTGLSWRDEHSAPFSWKTPSQIDLTIFGPSKTVTPSKSDSSILNNTEIQLNKKLISELTTKLENGTTNHDGNHKIENCVGKAILERNLRKKSYDTPDSPSVVLGGTCSKISGLCSKLKFLPGKSCSYEVKTVISYSPNSNPTDGNLLDKIKASTVLKIQNTIKFVGGKSFISTDKKTVHDIGETENLVQPKGTITITKLQKPSPKVNKPKSPPPPPPTVPKPTTLIIQNQDDENDSNQKMILVKNMKNEKCNGADNESEKVALLQENSITSFPSTDQSFEKDELTKVVHDISDELTSIGTECTTLSGTLSENIPKSGFDFLDNW